MNRAGDTKTLLEVRGVKVAYGKIIAVKGVDFFVGEGEIVCLIGANGAGKSTILLTISGILRPAEGEIYFAGEAISRLSPDQIVARGIAQVPEGRHIFPELTVLENLEMGAFSRKDRDGIKASLEEVFELFPVLKDRRRQLAGTLSGGEQQMLALGRALMAKPRLLLLDEPSLGLAPKLAKEIFHSLKDINKTGISILLVEQNALAALHLAHRGYVMETGSIALEITADDMLTNEEIRRRYLGEG